VQKRYPYLYHEYVGQYEDQKRYAADMPLSERLLDNIQLEAQEKIRRKQEMIANTEEEEESDEGEAHDGAATVEQGDAVEGGLTDSQKEGNKSQLMDIVYHKFLNGEDGDFDYTKVDNDSPLEYDEITNRDEESKYFSE